VFVLQHTLVTTNVVITYACFCAAGPERSGSTWLFNAVRLLLKHAHIPYDPYWITTLTTAKLQQRKPTPQQDFLAAEMLI